MIFPFEGLMAPVFAPFSDDSEQSLRLDVIPEYVDYLQNVQGIHGVLVNGTSGEGMSMTVSERNATTEAWAAAASNAKLTVMVQVGGACLKDVQQMAGHSEKHGIAGLLCLPDLFNKPATEADLVAYLQHVGRAAPSTPLLYYHMPAYTNVNLDMEKVFRMAVEAVPTFAGAKFTHTNLEEGARCLKVAQEHQLSVFLGCDTIMAGAFALGFRSAIATTLNMHAEPSRRILAGITSGDNTAALAEQRKLTALVDIITRNGGWVSTMKSAMNLMTPVKVGGPRPPLRPLTPPQLAQLRQELDAVKLIPKN